MGVADGQRVAVDAVSRLELPFVISGPHRVRLRRDERNAAGVLGRAALAALLRQPVAVEDGPGRGGSRELHARVTTGEVGKQLARSPTRVRLATGDDQRLDLGRGLVLLVMPGVAAISQRLSASGAVADDPLVGGLARDACAVGEFSDGVEALGVEGDKAGSFEHGIGDGPGHGGLGRWEAMQGECHPSARSKV